MPRKIKKPQRKNPLDPRKFHTISVISLSEFRKHYPQEVVNIIDEWMIGMRYPVGRLLKLSNIEESFRARLPKDLRRIADDLIPFDDSYLIVDLDYKGAIKRRG